MPARARAALLAHTRVLRTCPPGFDGCRAPSGSRTGVPARTTAGSGVRFGPFLRGNLCRPGEPLTIPQVAQRRRRGVTERAGPPAPRPGRRPRRRAPPRRRRRGPPRGVAHRDAARRPAQHLQVVAAVPDRDGACGCTPSCCPHLLERARLRHALRRAGRARRSSRRRTRPRAGRPARPAPEVLGGAAPGCARPRGWSRRRVSSSNGTVNSSPDSSPSGHGPLTPGSRRRVLHREQRVGQLAPRALDAARAGVERDRADDL